MSETKEHLSDAGAAICDGRCLAAGTLMFSFKLSIGAMAFAGRDLFTNEAIAGLLPKKLTHIDIRYVRHALAVADYDELIGHAAMGRTLNRTTLERIPIPVPPLEEQRRIVARLEARMHAAEQARTATRRQLEALEALRAALLREAFAA